MVIKNKKIDLIIAFTWYFSYFVKQFFKKVKIIVTYKDTQFTSLRTFLWKKLYTKAHKIFKKKNLTKNLIYEKINYSNTIVTNNPIITRELFTLSRKLNEEEKQSIIKK